MAASSRALAGALALASCLTTGAHAHGIIADGVMGDWFGVAGSVANIGRIQRDVLGRGVWIWRDGVGDASPGAPPGLDLLEVRVTASLTHLHVLALLPGTGSTSGLGAPQLQVAIDANRFPGSGGTSFVGSSSTAVAPQAAYEYLAQTRFGSGRLARVVDMSQSDLSVANAVLSSAGVMEISIPWAAMGQMGPPVDPLRLSFALFASDANDEVLPIRAPGASQAVDVVTQYGAPGVSDSTGREVADGVLDYWVDLWLDPDGDVIAPLVANELFFEGGVNSQWVELHNASQTVLPLQHFKVGDAEAPGGSSEAMGRLPSVLLAPGQDFVVARHGATFFDAYAFRAGAECAASDPGTPDVLPFAEWAGSVMFNLPGGGDQWLVLDGSNTVVDVVAYGNASWAGVGSRPGVGANHSMERSDPNMDRDDCALDFTERTVPTPGSSSGSLLGVEAAALAPRFSPPSPNPFSGRMAFEVRLSESGPLRVELIDPAGRMVNRLSEGWRPAGVHAFQWDGTAASGRQAPPGLYLIRASTDRGVAIARVARVR